MRTSPYSEDLRTKAITYLDKGKIQKDVSKIFGVHRNTLSRWKLRYDKEGNCSPRKRLGRARKLDYSAIESFVKDNNNCKLSDIANKFGISVGHAGVILKKLCYSYKKNHIPTWNQMKKRGVDI